WQRERPDIDANVMALVGRLLQAPHLLERNWFLPLAAQFELHQGEFDVIATLRRSGSPYAMTPTDLHEGLMLSSGAMTSRLDRLERKGLIERVPSPNDRRSTLV
ncbi:MarR family transcriptional regulator, partial [Paenibacillus polymyxa]|nr:MarR family transcriptional regulator [Paenibacillus polymyxa]